MIIRWQVHHLEDSIVFMFSYQTYRYLPSQEATILVSSLLAGPVRVIAL